MSGVTLRSINKTFGATSVLSDVSLDVGEVEFLTLLGPSGCGKSTLLRIVAGLETHDSGEVSIGGRPVDHLRPRERDVAMVFQSYALYPHMTVAQNIAVPLTMRRLRPWQRLPLVGAVVRSVRERRAEIDADVRRAADALEIEPLLDRKPSQLSGGQRQRVALARAMVRQPRAFLMDEPLSNLDAALRVQARAEIADLHRRLRTTFVYVTHDQSEAMTMSDRIAVMMGGRLLQVASPGTIYDSPADLRVAVFIGSPRINTLDGIAREGGMVEAGGIAFPLNSGLLAGASLTVAFRAEHADIAPASDANGEGLPGEIRQVENLGADVFVHVACRGSAQPVIVRVTPDGGYGLARGQPVRVRPILARILLFAPDGRRIEARP